MAVLTVTQTSPADLQRFMAGTGGTAPVVVSGATTNNAAGTATDLELLIDEVEEDTIQLAAGVLPYEFDPFPMSVGIHEIQVGGWQGAQDPHIFSTAITIEVVAHNGAADSWSVSRYLNFLAGNAVTGSDNTMPSARQAACTWAGVSPVDNGLIGALNIKAGRTDKQRYVPINKALNMIAYGVSDVDALRPYPWLDNQEALQKIAMGT